MPGGPPDHLILDRVELLKRPIEIERVELIGRDTVRDQRHLDQAVSGPVQRTALAGELLEVEEIDEARGLLIAELIRAVADDRRIDEARHTMPGSLEEIGLQLVHRYDFGIDLLAQGPVADSEVVAVIHNVPGDVAGLYHGLDLRVLVGLILDDFDVGMSRHKRLDPGLRHGLLKHATCGRKDDGDLFLLSTVTVLSTVVLALFATSDRQDGRAQRYTEDEYQPQC